jgi:hypothetical protein
MTNRRVEITLPHWLMQDRGYASRALEGEVTGESAKAIRVRARVLIRESDFCHRCHLPIDNPASRLLGYGPTCSERLGLPHAELLASMGKEERAAVLLAVSKATTIEAWLPKQHITIKELSAMARITRTIIYEGTEEFLTRQLGHSLSDGEHVFSPDGKMIVVTEGGAQGGRVNLFPTHEGWDEGE